MECKLCKSKDVQIFYTQFSKGKQFNYIYCPDCDLYQLNEVYDDVSLEYTSLTSNEIDSQAIWCQGIHKSVGYEKWENLIKQYPTTQKKCLKLLDIGCGTGGFLNFAKSLDLDLYGFDASEAQVNHAKKTFPNVKQAISMKEYLNLSGQPKTKFDLITLWDVVEHISNPIELFTEIQQHLLPSGRLFISVPNGGALKKKILLYKLIFRKICLGPWEHVFYYTPKSIRTYLEKCGFEVLEIGAVPFYRGKLSIYEFCRRAMHILSSNNVKNAPQIYALATINKNR